MRCRDRDAQNAAQLCDAVGLAVAFFCLSITAQQPFSFLFLFSLPYTISLHLMGAFVRLSRLEKRKINKISNVSLLIHFCC
jgi:hypothetical protein